MQSYSFVRKSHTVKAIEYRAGLLAIKWLTNIDLP